jgi:hypothetical protein
MYHLDAGTRFEKLAGKMRNGRRAEGSQRQLVGVGLRCRDERRDVLNRVVAMVTSTMVSLPIWAIGSKSLALSNGTVSFTAIENDYGFAQTRFQFTADNADDNVGGSARREGHDQLQRFFGVGTLRHSDRGAANRAGRHDGGRQKHPDHVDKYPPSSVFTDDSRRVAAAAVLARDRRKTGSLE